jgi:hypothetical protein
MDVSACALKRIVAHGQDGDSTAGQLTDDMNRLRASVERLEAVALVGKGAASLRIPLSPGGLQTAFLPGPYY